MENIKIYLAGGMSNISYEEQSAWRKAIKHQLENMLSNRYKCDICNPVDYYNFENQNHITEKEVMRFDLNKVKRSDLIIVNFNEPKSLGTMSEIAIAYDKGIPIIGINTSNYKLHPWQVEMSDRIFSDVDLALNYIIKYYLN